MADLLDYIPPDEHAAIADGTSTYDAHADLMQAINENAQGNPGLQSSGLIDFPRGQVYFAQPINLKHIVTLRGYGSQFNATHTLKFPPGMDGIIVNHKDTYGRGLADPGDIGKADGSRIEGLCIKGERTGDVNTLACGIRMRARAKVVDCLVTEFDQDAYHIAASNRGGDLQKGNANNFKVLDCSARDLGRHGYYADGTDVNAGMTSGFDAKYCDGYGVYESSFLGNTHIMAHVAACGGGYLSDNSNAANVFIGCYQEGSLPSSFVRPTVVIGGLVPADEGSAQYVRHGELSPFIINEHWENQQGVGTDLTYEYGKGDTAFKMLAEGDNPGGWAWQFSNRWKVWQLVHSRLDLFSVIRLTTDLSGEAGIKDEDASPIGPGRMIINKLSYSIGHDRHAELNIKDLVDTIADLESRLAALEGV
jgi:hypothetical protein